MLLIDLDDFKRINDKLGHHIGNILLQQAATRIQRAVRESDTVARLGGDEFVVLLPHTRAEGGVRAAANVLSGLEQPFVIGELHLHVGASIGIAIGSDHGSDVDTLMRNVDHAMYAAKQAKCGYVVYTPD